LDQDSQWFSHNCPQKPFIVQLIYDTYVNLGNYLNYHKRQTKLILQTEMFRQIVEDGITYLSEYAQQTSNALKKQSFLIIVLAISAEVHISASAHGQLIEHMGWLLCACAVFSHKAMA
jgi:hypothetical protein